MSKILNFALKIKRMVGRVVHAKSFDPANTPLKKFETCTYSGLLLMVSWWVPYLPKGCRPDFYRGLGGDSSSTPWRLFESDSNNEPSPGHSNIVSDEVYVCSSLLLMISWWLPYWHT